MALVLGGAAEGAAAATGPGVALTLPGGGSAFFGAAQIAANADVAPRTYTLRARPGEAGETIVHGGLSVRGLLGLAGLDPDAVGYLTVRRADAGTAYLPGSDFSDPPPFPEGPALVWVDAEATHLFRPVLDHEDANADDSVTTAGGEALALGVHDGALLRVSATAAPTRVTVGRQVSFSATAAGGPAGERLSYRWDFGDGTSADGAEASHAFGAAGGYEVTVTAGGDRESGGVSAPLAIAVGDPPPGAAAAGPSPRRGKPASRGTSGSGDAGHGGGARDGATGARPRPGSGARGPSDDAGDPGSPLAGASPSGEPAGADAAPTPAGQARHEPARSAGGGRTVSGMLVAGGFLEPEKPAAASAGGEPSRPSAERGGGLELPLAALAAMALCAAGALAEQRGWRLRLTW